MEKIRVITKLPGAPCEVREIEDDCNALQEFVHGSIDMPSMPGRNDIDVICNDEFLFNGMKANVIFPERKEVFCGPLIFAGCNDEEGTTISLTDEQIQYVMEYCKQNQVNYGFQVNKFDEEREM